MTSEMCFYQLKVYFVCGGRGGIVSDSHSLSLSEDLLGWEGQFFIKKKIVISVNPRTKQ